VGEGTGLGMGIVRDIVENKHGGQIHVETAVGVGTAITITIPVKK
jgi:signal transduction histidine kinase